jgi:hypothetical protein
MIRTATPANTLDLIGWLLVSVLVFAFAGWFAKQVGAPIELRLVAFVILSGIALAIWRVGRRAHEAAA